MSFQDTWPTATVDEQRDTTMPPEPGLYTVAVTSAKALTSQKGEDWVIIELQGVDGVAAEHQWSVLQGFKTEQQAGFTKRVCRDLGVDIDAIRSLDELDQALKQAEGRYFTVQVKQNGQYRNTYFQGAVTTAQPAGDVPGTVGGEQLSVQLDGAQDRLKATAPAANAGGDEDIPF